MEKAKNLEKPIKNAQRYIDQCAKDREWITIDEAENTWIEAASMLSEKEKMKK